MIINNNKSITTNIILSIGTLSLVIISQTFFYKYSTHSILELSKEIKILATQQSRALLLPQYYRSYLERNAKKQYRKHVLLREFNIYNEFISKIESEYTKEENYYTTNDEVIPTLIKQCDNMKALIERYNNKEAFAAYSQLMKIAPQSSVYIRIILNHMEKKLSQRESTHSAIYIIMLILILIILVWMIHNSKKTIFSPLRKLTHIINTLGTSDSDSLNETSHSKEFQDIKNALNQANKRFTKENSNLKKQAYYDSLTHLLNRRGFEQTLKELYKKRKATCSSVSILLIDVDHFKSVNDTYGHAVGDKVLTKISQVLSDIVRDNDVVARYGGEEFIFAIPCENEDTSKNIANRIKHLLSIQDITIESNIINITVSIGLYFSDHDIANLNQAIKYADMALYKAKDTGRNKVVNYSEMI